MGKNETTDTTSLLNEIEKFNEDLNEARNKVENTFDSKRQAIKEKLDPELKRLKEEFKAFAKHYEEFTGKRVKFSVGMDTPVGAISNGESKVSNKFAVLEVFSDGKEHKRSDVMDTIIAKYPEKKRGSLTTAISDCATHGWLKDGENGEVITDKGQAEFKSL